MNRLWALIKKDLHLMITGKFLLLAGLSLALFSLYINEVFIHMDTEAPRLAVYDPFGKIQDIQDIVFVQSTDVLLESIESGEADIGLDLSGNTLHIIQTDSGQENNALYTVYAHAILSEGNDADAITYLGEDDRQMKHRRTMANEVLFFQISTVGFLGIASLLYKEKSMGVLLVHGVIPSKYGLFILSKSITFLFSDLVFAAFLLIINLGPCQFGYVFLRALPHIMSLSLMMGLLGFLLSLICRDFKQFSIPFIFILILMITPVFLAGNATFDWTWMRYYPIYHLFMGLKKALFGYWTTSIPYYLSSASTIGLLTFMVWRRMRIELSRR